MSGAVHSLHPMLDDISRDTNGVLIYQEQIMAATRILAGFSMAEADSVRKAIGKKDMEKMKSIGGDFIKRAEEGWVTVSLDDGSTRKIHKAARLLCADGERRTYAEAMAINADITSFDI
ncbi:hypothetical protein [Escherichia coli]|uniref:hypothetical protein n=1 Tax=Escherichia coli TaxID=562 RepID=UPI003D76C068